MIVGLVIAGYLVGSIPVAWLLARLITGEDLRNLGSGNVGVMNTALNVTRWAGLLVFLTEAAKGMVAVVMARAVEDNELLISLTVLAAVVGTRWPIWLRGAGGRGNTTGGGAILLIAWPILLVTVVIWLAARALTNRSFLATRLVLLLWPAIFGLVTRSWWYTLLGAGLSSLYLSTQRADSDDHLRIKENWSSLWDFLTAPRRE